MNTSTRRLREFQQREQLFLEAASNIIRDEGISVLTMDKIAELTEYAKGTVYKHFTSKEDILCGLCVERLSKGVEMFAHAIQINGSPRMKMVAIGVSYQIFTNKYPEEFDLLIAARTNNIREKASEQRIQQMEQLDIHIHQVINSVIQLAIENKDLALPSGMQVDDLSFGLWATSFGLLALSQAQGLVGGFKPSAEEHQLVTHMNCLLDGYGWHPLSSENNSDESYSAALLHLDRFL